MSREPYLFAILLTVFAAVAARGDRVDSYVREELRRQRIPGASVAVVHRGRAVKVKGYGLANIELSVPVRENTVFQIQSITKSFTAAAIMMLVEDGRLGLEDLVSKHLENTPETWKAITVRHLLTHTSGIKDFINEPTASLRLEVTAEEVFKATAQRPLNFQPGERYAYSNSNYHLLGMILHRLSGKPFADVLKERIFAPIGMGTTRLYGQKDIIPNRAAGYLKAGDGWRNGEFVAPSILSYAGGGICSTASDMAKLAVALQKEKLLKKPVLEKMWAPVSLNNGAKSNYGFGWAIGSVSRRRLIEHQGAHMTGFTSTFCHFPEDDLTVVVLLNTRASPGGIALGIAGFYVPALALPMAKARDAEQTATDRVRESLRAIMEPN